MEEIFNQVLALLGGATIVLAALFGFIGKLWLLRIIEREKSELQNKLAKVQSNLDQATKKFEAELQRSVHVDKVQFEHEFAIYQGVWSALVELRMATMRLRPTLDSIDPNEQNESKEERMRRRLKAFGERFESYRDLIEKNKPFYSESVYTGLMDVLEKCCGESIDCEYIERKGSEYFKEARENQAQIVEAIEATCNSIRSRIQEVKVV